MWFYSGYSGYFIFWYYEYKTWPPASRWHFCYISELLPQNQTLWCMSIRGLCSCLLPFSVCSVVWHAAFTLSVLSCNEPALTRGRKSMNIVQPNAAAASAPSPLGPLHRNLGALRFFGFPLKFNDSDDNLSNKNHFGVALVIQGNTVSLYYIPKFLLVSIPVL